MKPKASPARKKSTRKAKPARKAVQIQLAGKATSFFKRNKKPLWSFSRVWSLFGGKSGK